jgi:hypothetical protein
MALVAATTLGIGHFDRVRAEVSADHGLSADDDATPYRLVVQSYAPGSFLGDQPPDMNVRPLGSVQRAITVEELRHGVAVDVVQIGDQAHRSGDSPVVFAWIERGEPNLEYDAMRARPGPDAHIGTVRSEGADARVRVVLRRRIA